VLNHDRINRGQYRQVNVQVSDHIAPDYNKVSHMMDELCDWFNSAEFLDLHPLEQAALAHFQLVCLLHTYILI
jgi:Fic family protein